MDKVVIDSDSFDDLFSDDVISAPLDINDFAGVSTGRLGPWLLFVSIGFGPLIFVPFLLQFIPLIIIGIFMLIWLIVIAAVTVGENGYRLKVYKKRLYDMYATISEIPTVKKVFDDGGVEYLNRQMGYILRCSDTDRVGSEDKSVALERFYSKLMGKYKFDIYIKNMVEVNELASRYKLVNKFKDMDLRYNYISIIDHNLKLLESKSRLVSNYIMIKGRVDEFIDLKKSVNSCVNSSASRAFKDITPISSREGVEKVMSYDLDTTVNFQELVRHKYCTEKYYGSKVTGYDVQDNGEHGSIYDTDGYVDRGFMSR